MDVSIYVQALERTLQEVAADLMKFSHGVARQPRPVKASQASSTAAFIGRPPVAPAPGTLSGPLVLNPRELDGIQPACSELFAARAAGMTGSPIDASMSLLQRQTHDVVRLAMGSPAAKCIPTATFRTLLAQETERPDAFDYGPTEGDPALRSALTEFLAAHGQPVPPEELLITTGGMQGLDLVCKLFIDPGDLVAVESPTYTNGTATISGYQGRMVEVPVDSDGMDVGSLAELVAGEHRAPKLIYTIPTFQNPSGATLSLARRERL